MLLCCSNSPTRGREEPKVFAPLLGPIQQSLFYWPILFLVVPLLLADILVLVSVWITYIKSEVTLTNKRLIFQTGFIMRISGELPLENVESIFLVEPLFGRWLGYGTVTATSIGGNQFPLRFIGKPQTFHVVLLKTVNAAKMPQRSVIESPRQDEDSRFIPKSQKSVNAGKVPQRPVTESPLQDNDSRYMPKLQKTVAAATPLPAQNPPSPSTHGDSRYMPKG